MQKIKKVLSASRIKTLKSCSMIYYLNYSLKIPQRGNSGSLRGSGCHVVFELLLKPRHRHCFDDIILTGKISGSKSVDRWVKKYLKKVDIFTPENYELMDSMILVGLKLDFFAEGGEVLEPELEFRLKNNKPEYEVLGYIDRTAIYKDRGEVLIRDYKSSKKKYSSEEDTKINIQAMIYSLAARTLWPGLTPVIQFIFLRFPKSPIMELRFTDTQLNGLKYQLGELYKAINNFTENDAHSNFAYDKPDTKWMCKMGKNEATMWKCPFLESFYFYAIIDKTGKVLKTAMEKSQLNPNEGESIIKQKYNGCPRHKPQNINI